MSAQLFGGLTEIAGLAGRSRRPPRRAGRSRCRRPGRPASRPARGRPRRTPARPCPGRGSRPSAAPPRAPGRAARPAGRSAPGGRWPARGRHTPRRPRHNPLRHHRPGSDERSASHLSSRRHTGVHPLRGLGAGRSSGVGPVGKRGTGTACVPTPSSWASIGIALEPAVEAAKGDGRLSPRSSGGCWVRRRSREGCGRGSPQVVRPQRTSRESGSQRATIWVDGAEPSWTCTGVSTRVSAKRSRKTAELPRVGRRQARDRRVALHPPGEQPHIRQGHPRSGSAVTER